MLSSVLALLLACGQGAEETPPPGTSDGTTAVALTFERVEFELGDFPSPSGVTYHPPRKTLFLVNDDGYLGEFRTDGTLVQSRHLLFQDFEAITCDPGTGLLYIAIEGRDDVLEVDPEGLAMRREYDLPRVFAGRKLYELGGEGIEGLAFVPNPAHPEGGTFFAANRSAHPKDLEDPPLVFEVELPLSSTSTGKLEGKMLRYKRLDLIELSGLHYDAKKGRLYALADKTNRIAELSLDGEILALYSFEAQDPEGIAFDAEGFLYIAQDSGGVLKLRPAPPAP